MTYATPVRFQPFKTGTNQAAFLMSEQPIVLSTSLPANVNVTINVKLKGAAKCSTWAVFKPAWNTMTVGTLWTTYRLINWSPETSKRKIWMNRCYKLSSITAPRSIYGMHWKRNSGETRYPRNSRRYKNSWVLSGQFEARRSSNLLKK